MINLVLCGGSGTRLWPLSRKLLPKQFVTLFDNKSLFQKTVERNQAVASRLLVVSNTEQYFLAKDQLIEIKHNDEYYLLESVAKNTAPAIALACLGLDEDDVVLVTPADHLIKNEKAYYQAVAQAKGLAGQGFLVTFGIIPSYPETGFGYIQANGNDVLAFKEKPDSQTAQSYIEAGNYYWNSGMFCFKAGVFLEELAQYRPDLLQACKVAYAKHISEGNAVRIPFELMNAIPEDSIDYAVMEKSQKIKVVAADMGWSDVGSFDALSDELPLNEQGNTILKRGEADVPVLTINAHNNMIVTRNHAIAAIDVDDLIVVDTTDSVLITKKGSSQKVKEVVAQLKRIKPDLCDVHRLAYRPWGSYEVLLDTDKYKIKRIIVKPGKKLSLQKHFHRSEHWVVVSGTAEVTNGDKVLTVRPNESTYIPMGEVHRLENKGKIDLVMIEVQVGEYTGEDDIVRLEDSYGRI
ncbi:MAG: mannose-1-phosphate guanylyltransferase/mannose-6-phosphate isomerase [Gammaproteobacteria bacterium]|nr:mannose-1-phosphate guanylyltransferase/mannose-6-phosphate isomerase [Gammaproteobacteria bacterium]